LQIGIKTIFTSFILFKSFHKHISGCGLKKPKKTSGLFGLLLLFIISTGVVFNKDAAARPKPYTTNSDTSKTKRQNKLADRSLVPNANCTFTAAITGDNCVGSTLKVESNAQPQSITWTKDGATVEVQTAGPFSNPKVVAGGHGNGAGSNQLNKPDRIWVDVAGNIYVPDYANARVQKWAPGATTGITVAGGNGEGTAANQLSHPSSVFVDDQGNVYITDQYNSRVQKWAPGATEGVTVADNLNTPTAITVNSQGDMFISEEGSNDVKKFVPGSATGVIVAGGNGDGNAANQFSSPTGLFLDAAGNLYVCDASNNRVQKWAPGATRGVTVAGGDGTLSEPLDVCIDAFGNMYITDYGNSRLQEWPAGARSGITLASGLTCTGVMFDVNNNLYVADYANGRILEFANPLKGSYTVLAPGKYQANVISKNGCPAITNKITVIATETPQLTISSNTTIVCPQFAPVFTAAALNGGTAPLYQWQVNGVNAGSNSSSATFSGVNLNPGDVVSCILTSNYPCVTSPAAASNNITLTAPTEVCSVQIAADNTEICYGTNVTFTAAPTNGGILPTYQWTINNQASGSGSSFTTNALNDGDKVSCIMTSNAAICQVSTTANSNIVPVIVHPVLSPAITISSGSLVYLANSTITFTALATDGGTVPAYQWQVNGLNTGTNSPTYVTDNLVDGDEISCTLTSNATCVTNASAASNKLVIKIITKVIAPNTFTPNGDGINDTWDLQGITAFPQCIVSIFTRYGQPVFHSVGYGQAWDGKFKGRQLSPGTYYYVIKLDDSQTISGSVTILR